MWIYLQYAATWVFFMLIIVGLCLITPKLAKKIDLWREQKKARMKAYEPTDPSDAEPKSDNSMDKNEDTAENRND